MKKIAVTYDLNDDQYARLKKITEAFNAKGFDLTPEEEFEGIMRMCSSHDIDEKLQFFESMP